MRFSKVANRSPRRRSLCRNNFTLLRKHRFEAKVLANQGRDILLRDAKDPKNAKRPANAANASPRPCDYDYITSHFYALLFPTSWSRDEEDVSTCWVFIDRSFFFSSLSLSFFLQTRGKKRKKSVFLFFYSTTKRRNREEKVSMIARNKGKANDSNGNNRREREKKNTVRNKNSGRASSMKSV